MWFLSEKVTIISNYQNSYINKCISSARRFLKWLTVHQIGYSKLTAAYLDTLKAPRITEPPKKREFVSLDEIQAIAHAPASAMWEKRIRAAAVFLYLSGMRVTAFATLPLKAVNLEKKSILQYPSLGVQTKNRKYATTYLLPIPELLDVIQEWDRKVRSCCPTECQWFAPLSPETGDIEPVRSNSVGKHRGTRVRKDLKRWMEENNLPYHSPHKFRHGHAVYGLKHADNMGDFKAVSQNLMHDSMGITDSIYGGLSNKDVQRRTENLLKPQNHQAGLFQDKEEIKAEMLRLISQI